MVERITEAKVEAVARAIEPETFEKPRINLYADLYERAFSRARRAIEAVAALSTEPGEAEGWQPIETAPHVEQQEFLVCNAIGERAIAVWWPLRGGWDVGIYYDDNPDAETALAQSWIYWRHLPAAPTSEGSHHG